jgi:hypothetical protein
MIDDYWVFNIMDGWLIIITNLVGGDWNMAGLFSIYGLSSGTH